VPTQRPRRSCHSIVGRRTAELDRRIGEEMKRLRLDSGLTHRALAGAAGIDPGYLSQLERGLREPSLTVLQSVAIALGADLSVRLYPNTGPVIHDRIQSAILDALLRVLASSWRRVVEAAVSRPARGVIDVVLYRPDADLLVAGEVESRIDRLEQQIRWSTEKAESLPSSNVWRFATGDTTPRISRLLIVRATKATRELAMRYPDLLATAYPASSHAAYLALHGEAAWPGPSLLWADVVGGVATIRSRPPRGVTVGR
jgi:transcriptional regulator with XRE-family HTH domain